MFTTRSIVAAGLMAALVTVGTMLIQIPVGISGYVHLGDSMVYFAGVIFGPVIGGLAAAIGSFLADMLSGYAVYAIPTFIIKGLDAVVIALVYKLLSGGSASSTRKITAYTIAFLCGTLLMASGYFLFETFMYGMEGAIVAVIPNLFQGAVGGVISIPFFLLFSKSNAIHALEQR
ncbi:MAG: ECF transporter S component [Clostridia bacterium]|nr:ECF transporter S component [Clostridia bacterium]